MTTDFYNDVPRIKMFDPLAMTLGAAKDGVIEYSYADVVKLAGHSCPTVAGAFLMIRFALQKLYTNTLPERGAIKVTMQGKLGDGVVGVISNVASFITGATAESGFQGIAGKFDRRNLLYFDAALKADMKLERVDNGESIMVCYNPSLVQPEPEMGVLFRKVASGEASSDDMLLFGSLWQKRVKGILVDSVDNPRLVYTYQD